MGPISFSLCLILNFDSHKWPAVLVRDVKWKPCNFEWYLCGSLYSTFKTPFYPYAFHSNRFQTLFIDQLVRSKATCSFKQNRQENVWGWKKRGFVCRLNYDLPWHNWVRVLYKMINCYNCILPWATLQVTASFRNGRSTSLDSRLLTQAAAVSASLYPTVYTVYQVHACSTVQFVVQRVCGT